MDNTDQNNLSGATTGGLPPVPPQSPEPLQAPQSQPSLNTTPIEPQSPVTPVSSTTTTTVTEDITPAEPATTQGSFQPETTGLDNPIFSPPPSVSAPIMTPLGESGATSSTSTTTTTTSATMDIPTPAGSDGDQETLPTKKKSSPIVVGLIAVLMLGLAGAGVFAVSQVISGQQAVAPTAPESEPAAYEAPITDPALEATPDVMLNPNEPIDCTGIPNTAPYGNQCRAIITDDFGNVTWADDSTSETPTTETPLP